MKDDDFPLDAVKAMGFDYVAFAGEASYNGVAILSKREFSNVRSLAFGDSKRHLAVTLTGGIELHNLYIPAGGDVPDAQINPKFRYKLDFIDNLTSWFGSNYTRDSKIVLVGDFNVAPLESDVWSHKQLLNVVSHTPQEVESINNLQSSLDLVDAVRYFALSSVKKYTWWSYRNRDWRKSDRGRRLDHIWVGHTLKSCLKDYKILKDARDWDRPSDHVPVLCVMDW